MRSEQKIDGQSEKGNLLWLSNFVENQIAAICAPTDVQELFSTAEIRQIILDTYAAFGEILLKSLTDMKDEDKTRAIKLIAYKLNQEGTVTQEHLQMANDSHSHIFSPGDIQAIVGSDTNAGVIEIFVNDFKNKVRELITNKQKKEKASETKEPTEPTTPPDEKVKEAAEIQRLQGIQGERFAQLQQHLKTLPTHVKLEEERKKAGRLQIIHPDVFDKRVIRDIQLRKDIVNIGGGHHNRVSEKSGAVLVEVGAHSPLTALDSTEPSEKSTERLRNVFTITVAHEVKLQRHGGMGSKPIEYKEQPTIAVVSAHGIQFENPLMNSALFFLNQIPRSIGKDADSREKFRRSYERLQADPELKALDDELHRPPKSKLPDLPDPPPKLKSFGLDRGAIFNYYKYTLYHSLHPFAGQDADINMVTLGGKYFSMLPGVKEGEVNKITAPLYYQALKEVLAEHPDEFKKMNVRICAHDEQSRLAAKTTFGFTENGDKTENGQVTYGEYHDVTQFDDAQIAAAKSGGKKLVIINPADQHANLGNELCYKSVEALIGESTDIVQQSPFCNPSALELSSYEAIPFAAALRSTATLETVAAADVKPSVVVPMSEIKSSAEPLPAPKIPEVKTTVQPTESKEINALDAKLFDALDAYAKLHFQIPKEAEKYYRPKFNTIINKYLADDPDYEGIFDLPNIEKEKLITLLGKGKKIPDTYLTNKISFIFSNIHNEFQLEVEAADRYAKYAKVADEMISDARNQLIRLGITDPDVSSLESAKVTLLTAPDGFTPDETLEEQIEKLLADTKADTDLILKNAIRNVVDSHLRQMGWPVSEPLSADLAMYQRMCDTLYDDIVKSGIDDAAKIALAYALHSSRRDRDLPTLDDTLKSCAATVEQFYNSLADEILKKSITDRCSSIYDSQISSRLLSKSEIDARLDAINSQADVFISATEDLSRDEKLAIAEQLHKDHHEIVLDYDMDDKQSLKKLKELNKTLGTIEKNVTNAAAKIRQSATAYTARVDHYIHNANHLLARLRSIYAGFGQVKDFEPYYQQVHTIKEELINLQKQFDEKLPADKKVISDLKEALKRVDKDIALMDSKSRAIKESAGTYKKGLKYIPSFADQSEVFEGTAAWEKEVEGKEFSTDAEKKPAFISISTQGTDKDMIGWTENIGKNAFRKNRLRTTNDEILADYVEGIDSKTGHLVSKVTALHDTLQTGYVFFQLASIFEKQQLSPKAHKEISSLSYALADYLQQMKKYPDDKDAIKQFLSSPNAKSIIVNGGGPHSIIAKKIIENKLRPSGGIGAETVLSAITSQPVYVRAGKTDIDIVTNTLADNLAGITKSHDYLDKLDTIALSMIHSHVALNRNVSKNPFVITSAHTPDLAKRLVVAAELWNRNNPDHPIHYLDRSGYDVMENVDKERATTTGDKIKNAAANVVIGLAGLACVAAGVVGCVALGGLLAYNAYKNPPVKKGPGFKSETELQKEVSRLNDRLINVSKAAADSTKTAADKLTGTADDELAKSPLAKIAGKLMPPKSKRTAPDTRPISADRASPKTSDLKHDLGESKKDAEKLREPPIVGRRR